MSFCKTGVLGVPPKCAFFSAGVKMHCLLIHCSKVFPTFAVRKEKPLQAIQEQNFSSISC